MKKIKENKMCNIKKLNDEFVKNHLQGHGEPEKTQNNMLIKDKFLIGAIAVSGDKEYYNAILTAKYTKTLFYFNVILIFLTVVIAALTFVLLFR